MLESKKKPPRKRAKKEPPKILSGEIENQPYFQKYPQFTHLTDKEIEEIADEMLDFFYKNKRAFFISHFATAKKMHRQKLYDLAAKNEYFAQSLMLVKDICITRHLDLVIKAKNPNYFIFMLSNLSNGELIPKLSPKQETEQKPPEKIEIEIISHRTSESDNTEQ